MLLNKLYLYGLLLCCIVFYALVVLLCCNVCRIINAFGVHGQQKGSGGGH